MSVLQGIIGTFAQFFNLDMWVQVLTDPVSWGYIGTLVILEGLLSADNALVLAVMVKHLPPEKRKKALFYGLLGAYIFRFIARSEERRVGKECRSRWSPYRSKKK